MNAVIQSLRTPLTIASPVAATREVSVHSRLSLDMRFPLVVQHIQVIIHIIGTEDVPYFSTVTSFGSIASTYTVNLGSDGVWDFGRVDSQIR